MMTTDMESHTMTKIKNCSSKKYDGESVTLSIVVGEPCEDGRNIKEELERQYKDIQVKQNLSSKPVMREEKDLATAPKKKRRGRPPKATCLMKPLGSRQEPDTSLEPPPLMVNQREKRKRSAKFNTFLEVLKGEKEFYIEDEGVEEPKSKKRGGGRKKRNLGSSGSVSASDQAKDEAMESTCIIQVTDMDMQERGEESVVDKDRLNIDEVVQEIFSMNTDADENSLIHDIEKFEHDVDDDDDEDEDLINVIDEMNAQHEETNENLMELKKMVNMASMQLGLKDSSSCGMKAFDSRNINNIKVEMDSTSVTSVNTPSIEVTEIKEGMAASMSSLEVTITHNEDNTLHAEINDPLGLGNNSSIIHQVNSSDTLTDKVKIEPGGNEDALHEKRYRCKVCSRVFSHIDDARRHAQESHPESCLNDNIHNNCTETNPYKCSDCHRAFPTARGRDRHHLHMHLKHRPVECPECHATFNSFRPLERHLRNHHDHDPTLYCEMCEAEFVLGTSLEHHKEIMHPVVSGKNKLVKTTAGSSKVKEQNKHSRVFECPFCNEEIIGARALRHHHRKKHNGKEYVCKYCKYKCVCLSTMHRHMVRVHKALDIKLYNCQKCMAGYQDPRDLEEHYVSVHQLQASYHCQHCGEKFVCMDMLRFHRSSHRAFSCQLCHLGFMKEEALEEHIKAVHNCDPIGNITNIGGGVLKQSDIEKRGSDSLQPIVQKTSEEEGEANVATVNSKLLVITSDGMVQVNEELKEVNSVSSTPSEDVTLHLQQTREGGLEEMDIFNPLKGQKVKDLPKKMNCPICSKVLTTKFLRTHMLSHKGMLPHKCHICDKAYAQGTLLRKHMKNRHYEEFLKMGNKNPKKHKVACDFCQEVYDTIYLLEEHLWEHMEDKTFECKDCKIKFGMESNLREHYKSHFFKEAQPCPVCRREFKSIGYYNEHVERCQQRWKCEHCGLECDSQDYYRKHQRQEHGGEKVVRYQCTQCDKSFVERHRYDDHIITHSSERAFSCHICKKKFKRQRPLNDHIMRTHSDGVLICSVCRKVFFSRQDLEAHKQKHRKEFSCTSCSLAYASSEALMNHLLVHHSENSHVCHICTQSFQTQASLKVHLITHSSNTPNICFVDGCHKMFRSEGLLRHHMSRHHHELQYECSVCDRKFALESDQIRHMASHQGETPFPCEECGQSFQSESLLEKHLLSHSQEKPYECRVCQYTTQQRHQLVRHIQAEHGFADATPHLLVNRWCCSVCSKMFVVQGTLLRHLREHTLEGVHAEGHAVKTSSTTTSALELSVPTGMVDPAAATASFLEQVSALSWQDLTPLLRLHVIPRSDEGEEQQQQQEEARSVDVWQCPGCQDVTKTEESMRDHLVHSNQCQEAVILQLACGFANTHELENEHSTDGQVLEEKGNGTVLQLAGSDGGMQYVIVHEEDMTAQNLPDATKDNQSEQESEGDMQVLVSMEDGLQHLLSQPSHSNIQIIVEDSAPLKQLLCESVSEENHHSSPSVLTTRGGESQGSTTPLLNGSEVLLQTPDGQLVLQQTVGGVTQFQLVEGVATAATTQGVDTATSWQPQPQPSSVPPANASPPLHPEFILSG